MPTEKPKPCPWCGKTPLADLGRVACTWAKCPMHVVQTKRCETDAEAIRRWNARAKEK